MVSQFLQDKTQKLISMIQKKGKDTDSRLKKKKAKCTTEADIMFNNIKNDSTNTTDASHLKLKLNYTSNLDFFKNRIFFYKSTLLSM